MKNSFGLLENHACTMYCNHPVHVGFMWCHRDQNTAESERYCREWLHDNHVRLLSCHRPTTADIPTLRHIGDPFDHMHTPNDVDRCMIVVVVAV